LTKKGKEARMKLHISEEEKRIEVKRTICLLSCGCVFFLLYLSPSNSKLQKETSNQRAFFFSKGKTTLLFVAFRLLVRIVQTTILFQTIERDCFGQRGE
jgi:hypothetical protein